MNRPSPSPGEVSGRADVLALLAVALRPPTDRTAFQACLQALEERLASSERDEDLAEAVRRLLAEPRPDREYHRLFLGPMKPLAPPFESVYREGVSYGSSTAAFLRELKEVGLEPAEGFGLPADHVAMELEYLAILLGHAEDARRKGQHEDAEAWSLRARAFVDAHLARWLPAFFSRLESAEPRSPYVALVRAAMEASGVPPSAGRRGGA